MLARTLLPLLIFCAAPLAAQQNFTDRSAAAGLANTTGLNYGINVVDYDGDGDDDFFVGRLAAENWLFRNNGDGTFTEVGAVAGVAGHPEDQTYAACWGDLDNDGDADLYAGNRLAPDRLYENLGDGRFREISQAAGITNVGYPRSVNLADVDKDRLLDVYVTNFRAENVLYRNLGNLTFRDETGERSAGDPGISMGSMFLDFDRDGDADLYLTHDNYQPNILLQNDGYGSFTDVSQQSGTNRGGFGMGVDAGDVNNDGWPDIYVTNLYDNFLFLNRGDGTFDEVGTAAGVNDYGMGWGTLFLDYDNDGRQDIYVVNNSYFSPYPNVLYRNLGRDTFANVTNLIAEGSPYGGYAAAATDLDRDGLPDLLVTNTGQTGGLQFFRNVTANDHHWLALRLEGTRSNRDAVGALVTLETDSLRMIREVVAGSGYAAQNSRWLHFGLGPDSLVRRVFIEWPSGETETLENLTANQFLAVTENNGLTSNTVNAASVLSALTASPNPVGDFLTVEWTANARRQTTLRALSPDGRVLKTWSLDESPGRQSRTVATEDLPVGVIIVQLEGYAAVRVVRIK